ncbi:MAG: calcium/proton exchanger [Longimicrobiaceae bacterium]
MTRLFRIENILNLLLIFLPIALLLEYGLHASPIAIFGASAIAIIPLAGLMGRATEQIAEQVGEGLGGLLNATFGNAAELIIAIVALQAGLHELVKASITGSIIGNILLVFGLATLYGGLKFERQEFNRTAASLGATLLVLSAIGLLIPAIFYNVAGERALAIERELSLEIAIVLMATYLLSLLFALRTHRHLYVGHAAAPEEELSGEHPRSFRRPLLLLLAATAGVALMSEQLVGAVEATAETLGWNEVFVGVIVVAIVGNAAEHSSAVLMAGKNKMDISINIAVGSSMQIALFVAPLLLFLSYFIGPRPMDLLFTTLEVVAVSISVLIAALISQDGESRWMEGVRLLAVYVILGIAFFNLPM